MEGVQIKDEPMEDDVLITDATPSASKDIKEEREGASTPSSVTSNPIVITPATPGTKTSQTGKRFGDWSAEATLLIEKLASDLKCPVGECAVVSASGQEFWSHYLENHWDSSKFNNYLCTGCLMVFGLDHQCTFPRETPWLYICSECGCPKEKLADLESHVGTCAGGISQLNMGCSRCPAKLTSVNEFWKHYSAEHWNKKPGYLSLAVGQKGETGTKIHLCLPCGAIVPVALHQIHAKSCHAPTTRVRCLSCLKQLESGKAYIKHFRETHWSPTHFYQLACFNCGHLSKVAGKCCLAPKWRPLCSFCGEEYMEHSPEFKSHRKYCLGIMAEDGTCKIPRDCKECSQAHTTPQELAAHVAETHPKEAVKGTCKTCPDAPAFDSGMDAWRHQLSEHKTEALTRKFLCKDCGMGFKGLAGFFMHQVYEHCKVTPPQYLCNECGHNAASPSELSSHKADHADTISNASIKDEPSEGPPSTPSTPVPNAGKYTCTQSGCNKVFTDLGVYWAHFRQTHWRMDLKLRFLCGACGTVYESVNKIMEHNLGTHQGNATAHVLCSKCGEKFLDSDAMEDHAKICSGLRGSWPQCDVCKR